MKLESQINDALTKELDPTTLTITNNSKMHKHYTEKYSQEEIESHFHIKIKTKNFNGKVSV